MSSIKDVEQANNRQLETLRRRQSREMNHIENSHQQTKAELKKAQEAEIVDLQDESSRHLAQEAEKTQKVLNDMRSNLQRTQQLTDKELLNLKQATEKARAYEHERLSMDRERRQSDHEMAIEELSDRLNQQNRQVHLKGQEKIQKTNQNLSQELAEKESHFSHKINQQTQDFNARYQHEGTSYQKLKTDQDFQFKKERMATNQKQQLELVKLNQGHIDVIEVKDNEFRKGLKTQDEMFEAKYKETLQNRNADLKRLSETHDKVISKMKTDLTEKLTGAIERSDDPFYKFTELKPTMKQYPDRVEIKVEIPEHSKTDVQLTIHNKEAIINFNRRYDDTNKAMGVVNKLHKVESYTTRLMADAALNPKSVKSHYADGVMTYIVGKG